MTKKTVVFELGTEELPALELHQATLQITKEVSAQPGKLFEHDSVEVFTTPRRIIVRINGVPEFIPASMEEYKGPAERIAFKDGQPTPAAIGFARGKGLSVEDLELREVGGENYVFAVKQIPEKKIADILPGLFLDLIKNIKWKKTQRWGTNSQTFVRPIRWICFMFGADVLELEYAGVKSGNITYGHRFLDPQAKELKDADELIDYLASAHVVLTESQREETIRHQVKDIEAKTGLVATLPAGIMQEVVNLCEFPTCMVGQFDQKFLEVPKEIIVDAMLVHQRYFPLFSKDGALTNKFIIVSNGNPDNEEIIVDGNQRVVAARLYDAQFFFEEDKKHPLESYVKKLDDVVFQELLGTMKAKANRLSCLAEFIAKNAGLTDQEIADAKRAGLLAKADLVSGAVIEFTQTQGIMGSYYALASGENEVVAKAIGQHYMPRFAGDDVPEGNVGKCVAAADKIDNICGLFAASQIPTGSSDPFALRRGAIGLISILKSGLHFNVPATFVKGFDLLEADGITFDREATRAKVLDFVITRTKVILRDQGIQPDTIEAVSSVNVEHPLEFIARCKALNDARANNPELFMDLATAYARANNLRDAKLNCAINEQLFGDVERKLNDAIIAGKATINQCLAKKDYEAALKALAELRAPIDNFFEGVMVKDKDEALRNNRIMLLNNFVDVFTDIADFGKMAKAK